MLADEDEIERRIQERMDLLEAEILETAELWERHPGPGDPEKLRHLVGSIRLFRKRLEKRLATERKRDATHR